MVFLKNILISRSSPLHFAKDSERILTKKIIVEIDTSTKQQAPPTTGETMTKVAVVYYSVYGHIAIMAEEIKKGVEEAGATCDIYQAEETLPEDVLTKMGAPPKKDHPIATPDTLAEYDGVIFGVSGRYGSIPAQLRALFDASGSLWQKGALVGKACGCFQATGCQGGGQETIALTGIVPFATHHGMVFVPLGYRDPSAFSFDEPHGASPYGAGTLAGPDGSRMPSDLEKGIAKTQGKSFAEIAGKLAK